jgi:hypothetical protein
MSKIKSNDEEIRRACREAGCEDFADMLIETGNGLAWALDWLKEHGEKKPRTLDPEAIYRRFNNPPKRTPGEGQ